MVRTALLVAARLVARRVSGIVEIMEVVKRA